MGLRSVGLDALAPQGARGTVWAIAEAKAAISSNGDHDLIAMLAAGAQLPISLAQSYLGLPADGLDLGRQLLRGNPQLCGVRAIWSPSAEA
jgi:hypothetical protein